MEALDQIVREQEQIIREKNEFHLNFNKFLSANPPQPESLHIDLQIQSAVEELRRLKAEYIEVRTQELFVKTLLTAKSLDDLPTSQETGRAEVALQEKKRELRKIKAERAKAESELTETVEQLGHTVQEFNRGRDEAKLRLRQARIASRSAHVRKLIQSRDVTQIESLVDHIDELDASCCQDIINILREERALVERQAIEESSAVENLRREVEELESDVQDLGIESNRLEQIITAEDSRNPKLAKLRHECMLQKELEKMLSSLTGVRVSEIHENGISFFFNANALLPSNGGTERNDVTHTIKIELLEDRGGESNVSSVSISPEDISVADVCNGNTAVSLCIVMQTICSRLLAFASQKAPISRP